MIADPIADGLARGWNAHDASRFMNDRTFEVDVAIVGTGAGGATAARVFAERGLRVVLIEEGPLHSSRDFHMLEREAYPQLYQESASRKTKDKGVTILQGRAVGGSTTVNWTSSFRTPPETLAYWRERFGLNDYTEAALAPWFAAVEKRLNIAPWAVPPNANNAALERGARRLGIPTAVIPRNVKGCYNLGYCGMGCPTNAKQSMLVTAIPAALDRGAVLLSRTRAERFVRDGDRVVELQCSALDPSGLEPGPYRVTVRARTFVAAGGAINTPALLLRSDVPDPYERLGKRTFLHPVVISSAVMPEDVRPFSGAPQSIYSDHFLSTQPIDGPVGFKLETPPVHPVLLATTAPGFGEESARAMADLAHLHVIIALLRDGFHDESPGGTVERKDDGTPLLDYPMTPYLWEGVRRAYLAMAQIQFAAGASSVKVVHESAVAARTWDEARTQIASLPLEILRARVVSAHVMGGCAMGADPRGSVVGGDGRHHQLENLYVFDGSVFPTSLGANPQLSIYGIVERNAQRLLASLGVAADERARDDLPNAQRQGPPIV